MKKRAVSVALVFALVLSLVLPGVEIASGAYHYDPYGALLYASEHWNDGQGLCAEFVWNCVEAGGLDLSKENLDYSWRTTKGAVQGICNAMGKEYTGIADLEDIYGNEKVSPGDVIIWYDTETGIARHVALCCFANNGNVLIYGHNPAAEGGPVIDWGGDSEIVKFLDISDVPSKDCSCKHYYDVRPDAWYHEYVDGILDKELMNGLSFCSFAPEDTMTRAMLVTVLWRFNWEPLEGTNNFGDIQAEQWYTDAVTWASHKGIVNGVGSGRFDPEGIVTREQLAAILYRYASQRGDDVGQRADLNAFPDRGHVSAYAEEALSWAVAAGLVGGTQIGSQTYLDPQGSATRAQVAAILLRFIEAYGVPSASGQCGDSLNWEFTPDGTLTITGSGDMWDSELSMGNTASWGDCAKYIKTVILPEGLTKIGDCAFAWCEALAEVRFPEVGALTRIGSFAFFNCEALLEIHIPENVTSVGENAYNGTAFSANEANRENSLLYADGWALTFMGSSSVTEVSVKEGTKGIADGVFSHNVHLESVTLPDSVMYLGDGTFYECCYLKEVRLPAGIKEIREETFYNCWHLEQITLPANVTRIGEQAFEKCSALTAVYFLGDAPVLDVKAIPYGTVLYYVEGTQGWTSPSWNGYATQIWTP